MKRWKVLLISLLLAPALALGAYKGYWRMKGFPADLDPVRISPSADPANFPDHPGTIAFYVGSRFVKNVPAAEAPDEQRFVYEREVFTGRVLSRTPVVKIVSWYFKDHLQVNEGEPFDAVITTSYDANGKDLITGHGGEKAYH